MHTTALDIRLSRNEIGFFAHCPSLRGCHGLGETPEEAMEGFMDSLRLYAQTLPASQAQALLSQQLSPGMAG